MSLLLAPYNNAMRLGQGFNSFTQRICIDSAVVVSPHRAENFLTNDGMTMRTLAEASGMPSLWTTTEEVLLDESRQAEAEAVRAEQVRVNNDEEEKMLPGMEHFTSEERLPREELIRARARREASKSDVGVFPPPPPYEAHQASLDRDAKARAAMKSWSVNNVGGPSQTVTFTSRFVDNMSQVVKDMGISASLSIKCGTISGSGRGSFIQSDTFAQSDLNYYISVKCENTSINFKDPLEFAPLPRSVVPDSDFAETYGDSYISGFLEGGIFEAIVSFKVLNTAKMLDIKAAASVAFSSGALDVKAEASFAMAKANLALNTETSITARWSGGGVIKPPDEPWTIETLMRAAVRFPQNVAQCPQRTYAILTKYDHLRSYLADKPVELSKQSYENLTSYSDELLEMFMEYKAMLARCQADIRAILEGTKRFKTAQVFADDVKDPFPASIDGLEAACTEMRPQLGAIAARIDELSHDASLLSSPENFTSPIAFWQRLPVVEDPATAGKLSSAPLTGKRIGSAPPQRSQPTADPALSELCEEQPEELGLTKEEEVAMLDAMSSGALRNAEDGTTATIKMSRPVGSREDGVPFFGFTFARKHLVVQSIEAHIGGGALQSLLVTYSNGLQWRKGAPITTSHIRHVLDDFRESEVIISGWIEYGAPADKSTSATVTALGLRTSAGRTLNAEAVDQLRCGYRSRQLDGKLFTDLKRFEFVAPSDDAALVAFYGTSREVHESEKFEEMVEVTDKASADNVTPVANDSKEGAKADAATKQQKVERVINRPTGIHRLGFVWSEPGAHETRCKYAMSKTHLVDALTDADPVEPAAMASLLPQERRALLTLAARSLYKGKLVGRSLISRALPGAQGKIFSDVELLRTTASQVYWPTKITFFFSTSHLCGLEMGFGKMKIARGECEGQNVLPFEVKLEKTERVSEIRVQRGPDGVPSGLLMLTSAGKATPINWTGEDKGGQLNNPDSLRAPQDLFLQGFFGIEIEDQILNLRPIWA
ncbi:hypothetical protein IE81DRAFT_322028 [Ceraceosorus guamensis]|uniref:Jacalin-type lectin domain-containing protein n=1 Tax=Ceraceosorus guamensis TaxID=1522189 RepID=A0A316W1W2_9BASI|nr:hypothetical protein IE81DRAFT_322028 [Ceraceosorus guamensis]PWN43856.1 hypothetical protein IE81DRAFT_322028 [Ceraceosorus guamensis]